MLIRRLAATGAVMAGLVASAPPAYAAPAPAKQLANDFRKAWQTTRGKGATVAILSSGVDPHVRTLAGAVKKGADFVKNGHGKQVTGTLLASMIAGSGPTRDSPFGIRGLAPAVDILPVRVFPDPKEGRHAVDAYFSAHGIAATAKGITYAADHGADVICVDDWVTHNEPALIDAVLHAQARGAVVVAADRPRPREDTGYKPDTSPVAPAGQPGVIGVGAVDLNGHRIAKASAANTAVLVTGPGVVQPATGPGNDPYIYSGVSPAMAWVSAAAALVKAEHPKLSSAGVALALARSARHPKGGYSTDVGFGLVNPGGALDAAAELEKVPQTATSGVAANGSHFAKPVTVEAVRHDNGLLAGGGAAVLVGVLLLAGGVLLWFRRTASVLETAPETAPETVSEVVPEMVLETAPEAGLETGAEGAGGAAGRED